MMDDQVSSMDPASVAALMSCMGLTCGGTVETCPKHVLVGLEVIRGSQCRGMSCDIAKILEFFIVEWMQSGLIQTHFKS